MLQRFYRKHTHKGQNLVELVLTFPLILVLIFAIIEMGRVWQTYQGVKMAAIEGAYVATTNTQYMTDSTARSQLGAQAVINRLQAANITFNPNDIQVSPIDATKESGFKVTVKAKFQPLMGGLSIPTLSGSIPLFQGFDVQYTDVKAYSVY